jgi:hypothetical protein
MGLFPRAVSSGSSSLGQIQAMSAYSVISAGDQLQPHHNSGVPLTPVSQKKKKRNPSST